MQHERPNELSEIATVAAKHAQATPEKKGAERAGEEETSKDEDEVKQTIAHTVSRLELEAQAKTIVENLGGKWVAGGAMCLCPAHDDSTPSLSVRVGRSSLLLKCFAGCDTVDVIRAVRSHHLLEGGRLPVTQESVSPVSRADLGAKAREIWSDAHAVAGSPAERYLVGRGLSGPFRDLRYHPRTPIGKGVKVHFRPAMIAAVRDEVGVIAIHRTFLEPSTATQASDLEKPKLALGRLARGAVRLSEPTEILGLAEGVETALSAAQIHGIPVWAVLGNARFAIVHVPKTVKQLVFLGDRDRGGRLGVAKALETQARDNLSLYQRWPPEWANDWNDVLRRRGGGMSG